MGAASREGGSQALRWRIEEQEGLTTVFLSGELDLSSAGDLTAVATPLLAETSVLVFDLGDLGFMDSTGLRILAGLKRDAEQNGRRFRLSRLSAPARRVIHVAGLIDFFDHADGTL